MLAPPQRHKRPRSPSPPPLQLSSPDLTSPLDVLLKRRRRDERSFSSPNDHHQYHQHNQNHDYFDLNPTTDNADQPHAESSTSALKRSMKGVERRRTKQWEKQNAPSASASQPTPPPTFHNHAMTPNQRNYRSQPDPLMSSSPIRNVYPSSSPFRAKDEELIWQTPTNVHSNASGEQYAMAGTEEEGEDGEMEIMDEDEMKRQWGEAYQKQNWLLRNLHLAKIQSQSQSQHPIPTHHQHSHPSHTPLHNTDSTSSTSTYINEPTLVSPHPSYRNQPSYPDSSPFNSHHPSVELHSPSHVHDGDEDMEVLDTDNADPLHLREIEDEVVRKRYEETNRLLGELAVVRQRRWG
ncbi:hypothetical protein L486_02424 [Kwoniella mangroviensis CBS 10435]|uniref:Uncharacterized protein n=1 Tax=Kwoniella mangroviensis CBS 10435 TaxID=1331196 RepID=A0A1B9IW50_9TREE|nr:hypothetical protein L486_02424 [Kwoniella mangroviensis CBS 10435]